MTRNQKIALGCGGAGCLGLIVVAIAGVLIFYFASPQMYSTNRNSRVDITTNRNSNSNDNSTANVNENDNSSSTSSSTASSMSDDDKHKLYQAAMQTGDVNLRRRVEVKLGLMNEDYTPGDKYQAFLTAHVTWTFRNTDFIASLDTTEKARAYVDENIPD